MNMIGYICNYIYRYMKLDASHEYLIITINSWLTICIIGLITINRC